MNEFLTACSSRRFVVHIFTLLLVPFASEFVNYLNCSQSSASLKILNNSKSATFSVEKYFSKTHCASNSTVGQFGHKRLPKEKMLLKMRSTTFYKDFSKYSLLYINYCRLSKNFFATYVHTYVIHQMAYFERYCMLLQEI